MKKATVFPTELSSGFTGFQIASEKLVFEKFASELQGEFFVFHDIRWDDPQIDDSKKSGQIDFVVVHPEAGFIALEVKGGRCTYDPDYRMWTTIDRNDHTAEITDPFDQARTASRVLTKILLRMPRLTRAFIPHHHAVVFTDCVLEKVNLRGDIKKWQILDRDSLFDLNVSIAELFRKGLPANGCSRQVGNMIIDGFKELFGNRRLVGKSSVSAEARDVTQKVIRLTDEQLELMNMFREHRRLVIQGCAGSGKTTLALHKARMAADCGQRVLVVCFNRPLGQFLADECISQENVTAGALYDLALTWLEEIGVPTQSDDSTEWWTSTLPNLVVENIEAIRHRFEAIIVDEGQDFHANWWLVLELLIADQDSGVFFVFMDCHQNIYHGRADFPMTISPVILSRNVRNTNQICAAIVGRCKINEVMKASGIDGPEVQWTNYSSESEMLMQIENIMAQLVREGFRPADVVILGTKSQKRTVLKHGTCIGPFPLVEKRQKNNELVTMTVHRFKGLESQVVILCELDEELRHNASDLLYIGMSRAISLLYVLTKTNLGKSGGAK